LIALLVCCSGVRAALAPAGTRLEVSLSTCTGSRISHSGDAVSAAVIAPVAAGPELLLLKGATLSGSIEEAVPVGLGVKRGSASLQVRFERIRLADGTEYPIKARIVEVETARERVDAEGTIEGIDPAANVSSAFSFLMSTALLRTELEAPALVFKLLAARSPDFEIYLGKGTELIVELTRDLVLTDERAFEVAVPALGSDEVAGAYNLLNNFPDQQAELAPHRSSDLVNLMLLGSPDEVDTAFRTAGWTGESRHSALALYRMYHCLVQRMGYAMAPMSALRLNGLPPSRTYQKSLDTLSKRHHVRFWRQKGSVWLGAASEDVALTVRRMHLTHAIDSDIDNERAKVVNDLWSAGCLAQASLLPRTALKPVSEGGLPITTDGDIAVLRLKPCDSSDNFPKPAPSTAEARVRQVFQAAEDEVIRANPLTVSIGLARAMKALAGEKAVRPDRPTVRRPQRPSIIDVHTQQIAAPDHLRAAR
jgi:hypothetical protein